jgi:diguanylate cyclase (GGDEF)-like protein
MDNDALIAWQFKPALDAAAAGLAALAAYVALDFVRRCAVSTGRVAGMWLAGAALSFGTGLWSVHFIMLASSPLPFPIGYGGELTAAGWLLDVTASGAALAIGFRRTPRPLRLGLAALLLACGAVAGSVLYLLDLRVSPSLQWRPLFPALALAELAAVLGACGWIVGGSRRPATRLRLLAALLIGLAVAGASRLTALGAEVPLEGLSLNQFGAFSDTTLTVLAALGSLSLLTTLLTLSVMEARMRAALQAAIARIEEAARTDALTRLPNRHNFDQRLEAMAHRADRVEMALLFIGLDNFKPVNDSFGRRIGDMLLQRTADRMREAVGTRGMLARVGGDEFVLLLDRDAGKDAAAAMAKRLLATIAEPCEIEGRTASVSGSIGIVLYPHDGSLSKAMAHAEAAAGYVKRHGGAAFAMFEPSMLGNAREQVELLRDLRLALAGHELELYYQPKVHAPTGEITGAEALLRWNHPQRGMVSPTVFVPIAERHGLIGELGEWVIDESCRQARAWRDHGLRMRVAINLSVHQLRRPDLPDRIDAALKRHQINPDLLTCEITESVAMEDSDATMKIFERLAAIGVHISIDDFGTGYSSLSYLRKLPVGELKIDRSFVLDLETSDDACAVVEAVVKLAHTLGLKVVAEGVETEGQNRILRSFGCDQLQGYLFAKPMSAKALTLWAMDDGAERAAEFRDSLFKDTQPAFAD